MGGFEPRRAIYDELKAEDPTLVKLLHSADANTVKQEVHLPDFLRDDASAPNGDTDVASPPKVLDSDQQAFAGLSFYIASDVPISNVVSAAVTKRLQEGGAADVFVASMHMKPTSTHRMQKDDSAQVKGAYEQAWEKKLAQADYVVCKERSGWEYWLVSPLSVLFLGRRSTVSRRHQKNKSQSVHYYGYSAVWCLASSTAPTIL